MIGEASPFMGRGVERDRLIDMLERLEPGASGGVIVVEGEPGIGKTRLIAEVLAAARARDLVVWTAACSDLSADLPLGPMIQALGLEAPINGDVQRAAARAVLLGEGSGSDDGAGDRSIRALHAIVELVENACERGGAVLALDDLQWSDRATLVALERVTRRCAYQPLVVLLAARPYPVSPELSSLMASVHAAGAVHLPLGPLDDSAVRELVEATIGAAPDEGLMAAVGRAGGNPLFVSEVLASASTGDGDALPAGGERSLRRAILRRIGFLPPGVLEVLRSAALLGAEFDVRGLAVVAERPPAELAAPLELAVEAGLLSESGGRLAFRHDLVREAIYGDRPPAVTRALHFEAARRLREAGASPLTVAAQLLRGVGEDADDEAELLLRETAARCSSRAPAVAVQLLERAVELVAPDDPQALDLKAELARSLLFAGRWSEGERVTRELTAAVGGVPASSDLLVALAHAGALRGSLPEAIVREVDAAVGRSDAADPDHCRILATGALAHLFHGSLGRARELCDAAIDASGAAGDELRRCQSLVIRSSVAWHEGKPEDAVEAAERATELARRLPAGLAGLAQIPSLQLAMGLSLLQRFDEALDALGDGMKEAEQTNNVWSLAQLHQALGVSRFYAGDLDGAEGEFEAALSLWNDLGTELWAAIQEAWLSRIALHRGDHGGARGRLEAAQAALPDGVPWSPGRNVAVLGLARALVGQVDGDSHEAFAALERARRAVADSGAALFNLRFGPEHVRLALAAGERAAAEEMTAATEAVAAEVGTTVARGQALRCRGLLEADPERLVAAVEAHRAGPSRIELAGAAEDAGRALAAAGDTPRATALLDEALEIWESAAAAHDAGRVRAALREIGAKPGARGPRRRALSGWESLTGSELRVLELVGEGLTYREIGERLFISRRTVETHIARVFDKLGVRSRAELAALLARRQSPDT